MFSLHLWEFLPQRHWKKSIGSQWKWKSYHNNHHVAKSLLKTENRHYRVLEYADGCHVFSVSSPPSAPWVETVVIMLGIKRVIFFNTQLPRLERTARVYSLGIHVPRMIREHLAPLGRPSPSRALRSRSARTGIPHYLLIAWSVGQEALIASSVVSRFETVH